MPHSLAEIYDKDNDNPLKMYKKFCDKCFVKIFILITCIKIFLFPTYHSTDFEVHRNWLAITHNLPINEWYTNEKSHWTLDYPPFFAWFEFALSKAAAFIDPEMLKINNLNYASNSTKLFQRATVIVADLVFVYGVRDISYTFCKTTESFLASTLLLLCNVGLLVVDHIHFQYNGFLLGILLISLAKVSKIYKESQVLSGAMWFAILLNLKHLYLYVAPAFGIWLLRSFCLRDKKFVSRFIKLGLIVIFITFLSFGPFIHQITQVFSRLFPFKRGLVHAYWAANTWALYAGIDKILSVILKRVGWLNNIKVASMTGGLVQEDNFTVLPTPTPLDTFIITFLMMTPALWNLFFNKKAQNNPKKFIRCVILCGLTSFMFGWHVHEKAILTALIPLCVLATTEVNDARIFILLSSAGHAALFPLLYSDEFTPLKLILWLTYLAILTISVKRLFNSTVLHFLEWTYVAFIAIIIIYETVLHRAIFQNKLPFLPLALTSMYCALGITYSYVRYYSDYMSEGNLNEKQRKVENGEKEINENDVETD